MTEQNHLYWSLLKSGARIIAFALGAAWAVELPTPWLFMLFALLGAAEGLGILEEIV